MANVIDVLDELQNRALKEPELKERLKNTKKEKEPLILQSLSGAGI